MNLKTDFKKDAFAIVSVQPDENYFHWQLQVQLTNFRKFGVEHLYHIVITHGGKPSQSIREIEKRSKATFHFVRLPQQRKYPPSVVPFGLARFFTDTRFGKPILFLDSDVLLLRELRIEKLLKNSTNYVSPAPYITLSQLEKWSSKDITKRALSLVGLENIKMSSVKAQEGGAQWLLKGCESPEFWEKVGDDSLQIYDFLFKSKVLYPGVMPWVASMYALLWNLWREKKVTRVNKELSFHMGSDLYKKSDKLFLHNSGKLIRIQEQHFNKLNFRSAHPFDVFGAEDAPQTLKVFADFYFKTLLEAKAEWLKS